MGKEISLTGFSLGSRIVRQGSHFLVHISPVFLLRALLKTP